MATPEKALIDKIQLDRSVTLRSQSAMREYLFRDLRIDSESLPKMDFPRLSFLGKKIRSKKVALLLLFVKQLREKEKTI